MVLSPTAQTLSFLCCIMHFSIMVLARWHVIFTAITVQDNKNRYVMAYFCWRVMVGLHREVTVRFQIPGHTKCLVDAGFAHIKKLYRRTDNDSLSDLVRTVEKSSKGNKAVVVDEIFFSGGTGSPSLPMSFVQFKASEATITSDLVLLILGSCLLRRFLRMMKGRSHYAAAPPLIFPAVLFL